MCVCVSVCGAVMYNFYMSFEHVHIYIYIHCNISNERAVENAMSEL